MVPQPGDVVCISALPPFALLNARSMAKRLRQKFPDLTIIVGLWTFTLSERAAERFGQAFVETVVTTLCDAVNQVQKFAEATSQEDSPGSDDAVARATPAALS